MNSDDVSESAGTVSGSSKGVRWRYQLLAFVPTLVLGVSVIGAQLPYIYMAYESPSAAEELTAKIFWVAGAVPFAMPIYLYFLGRRYVRVVHSGLKHPGPFALFYCAANLGVWLAGSCLLAVSYSAR